MTGLLKDLMDERAAQVSPHLDIDAIIDSGDKRIRRHKVVAATGVAAVAAAVVGAVVWQAMPTNDSSPNVTNPAGEFRQTIQADATPLDATHVEVAFTITGQSTRLIDAEGQPVSEPGPVNPSISVDGKPARASLADLSAACVAGGEVDSYSIPTTKRVHVSGPGEHTVEVSAPYCADGKLVESTTSVVVSTTDHLTVVDQANADIDGDGTTDKIKVLAAADGGDSSTPQVVVEWGSGGTAIVDLTEGGGQWFLDQPTDLDGDGALEILVQSGGGDTGVTHVITLAGGELKLANIVDAAGKPTELISDAYLPFDEWQTYVDLEQRAIYSYRFRSPDALPPVTVDVRTWELNGSTLTQSDHNVDGCWQAVESGFGLSLGAC